LIAATSEWMRAAAASTSEVSRRVRQLAPIERSANLGAETRARKLGTFSGDQPAVEPGRPFRRHLLVEVEI